MPRVRETQEMLLASSDVLSRCPFLSLVCGELMARWAGSTYLFLLPSSSAMNCRRICLPSKCPCCVSGETKDHQLQPGVAVCQGGAVLPMAWDPPQTETTLLRQDVPGRFPRMSIGLTPCPRLGRGTWLIYAWVYAYGEGDFHCSRDVLRLPLVHVSWFSKEWFDHPSVICCVLPSYIKIVFLTCLWYKDFVHPHCHLPPPCFPGSWFGPWL